MQVPALVQKLIGAFKTPAPSPEPVTVPPAAKGTWGPEPFNPWATPDTNGGYTDFYYAWMHSPADRLKEMQFYDRLEREIPEVEKALNAYATMATTGTLSGLNRGTFSIRVPDNAPPELKARMTRLQELLRPHVFTIARGMCQYGSYPVWLRMGDIHGGPADGGYGITEIVHLPPGTMMRNTKSKDQNHLDYWVQMVNGKIEATLSKWQTPHFALWQKPVDATETLVYGRSALKPAGRIGLQMTAMQDSLIMGRLTRAIQKLVVKIDCADLKNDPDRDQKILTRMAKWRAAFGRKTQLLSNGNADSYEKPPIPDEKYYIPSGDGINFDVTALANDANITSIDDVKYTKESFAGAVGVPLEYMGHSGDRGGRSVLSQVDINFARSARYVQLYTAAGIQHIVWVEMIAGGFSPQKYPCEVIPPTIGARDDLLQAQVRMLQAQVLKNLVDAGFDAKVDPKWVMMNMLNMDDELANLKEDVIAKMFKDPPTVTVAAEKQAAGKTAAKESVSAEMLEAAARGVEGYMDSIKTLLLYAESANTTDTPVMASHDRPSLGHLESVMKAAKQIKSQLAA